MASEVGALKEGRGFEKQSVLDYMNVMQSQISELKGKLKEAESSAKQVQIQEKVITKTDDTKVTQLTQQLEAEHQARIKEKQQYETEKNTLLSQVAEITKKYNDVGQQFEKSKKLLNEAVQKATQTANNDSESEAEIAALQAELNSKKNELDAKNSEITALASNIDDIESKLADANLKLSEADKIKVQLEKQLAAKDAGSENNVKLEKLLAEKNADIEHLSAEISRLKEEIKNTPAKAADVTNIDISNVSPIVAQLLESAQTTAEATKNEAAKNAFDIRREAEDYAENAKAEVDDYVKKCRSDADGYALGIKAEADKYAERTRFDADTYCKESTAKADREAKETVEKAKSEATKIVSDARNEARIEKVESEKESIEIASAVKDIKDLLKVQITEVGDTLKNISDLFIGAADSVNKAIGKAEADITTVYEDIENKKISELLADLEDIKQGRTPDVSKNKTSEPAKKASGFNIYELTEALEK